MEKTFLLYGANGYTGELITRYAVERDLKPILAGRNEAKIKELAEKTICDSCFFAGRNGEIRRGFAGSRIGSPLRRTVFADFRSDG